MLKGLWNYAVKAHDLEGAVRFYVETLEAQILRAGELLGCRYHLLRVGTMRIIVFDKAPYEESLGLNLPEGFLHAVYEVTDHDAHVARLRDSGVRFIFEPMVIETDWDQRKIAFFEAPDGTRVEICEILQIKAAL